MNAAIEWSLWDEGGPTALPPDLTPWLPFGEPHCGAANSRGLICTRLPGHTGRHAAADRIRNELAGSDLACWCPLGQPCHADVLLEIANRGEAT